MALKAIRAGAKFEQFDVKVFDRKDSPRVKSLFINLKRFSKSTVVGFLKETTFVFLKPACGVSLKNFATALADLFAPNIMVLLIFPLK